MGLVNDGMTIEKTIEPEEISGKDVITAICEINGCFGHIGRDGKFHFIYLEQAIEGLYPANDLYPDHAPEWMAQAKTGHLYPQDPKSTRIGKGSYIKCQYEDYHTKPITKLQIRKEENDIGAIYPNAEPSEKDNCYIIQDNFLVYGKNHDQLTQIAKNIFDKITDIIYRPFDCTAVGNPCLEVGDPIRLNTKYEIVESYILTRTMKGIQALRDTYKSGGVEKYSENVNGLHRSIIQLKGKTNILTRTVEETKSEIKDVEKGLTTTITQTAGEIRGELANEVNGLNNTIRLTAEGMEAKLEDTKEGLETEIRVTAEGVKAEASQIYETKTNAVTQYTEIRSSVSVERDRISAEIQRAEKAEESLSGTITTTSRELSSKIEATEKNINLSVTQNIQETKKYADDAASAAQNAANAATDDKLKEYSTTSEMSSAISLSADSIKSDVSATYQTKVGAGESYEALNSAITQTSAEIRSEVSSTYQTKTAAGESYSALQSSITQTDSKIEQKVSKGNISSEISQEAGKIHIEADRLSIESTNFGLTEEGEITSIKGTIGGFTITEDSFGTDDDIISLHKHSDWAVRVGQLTEYGTPAKQYEFCVGHEGNVYCNRLHVHENLHIWGDIIQEDSTSTVSLSDRNRKKDISTLRREKAAEFIYALNPVSYRFKDGTSGRTHHGLISQEVKKAMGEDDWGLYVEWENDGDIIHGLRYEELIADLVATVQSLNNRVIYLENQIKTKEGDAR